VMTTITSKIKSVNKNPEDNFIFIGYTFSRDKNIDQDGPKFIIYDEPPGEVVFQTGSLTDLFNFCNASIKCVEEGKITPFANILCIRCS